MNRRQRTRSHSIDLSGLMDIIFILLIFVMISISFQKQITSLEMDLPDSNGSGNSENEETEIAIFEDGKILLAKNRIEIEDLVSEIKKIQPKGIVLNIEKKVPYETFILISEKLKNLGIKNIRLGIKEK
ncbi:MAG: biopolymer transporter ExbD [Leptospiraceae bacterium]|nr:biopolymer transporter ExbD [Leptospiraceae bacterium]MCP5511059.1 biopolymer transporter ExbD [Leptospiraceae bacterium]